MLYITADIGGTQARFAIFKKEEQNFILLHAIHLSSREKSFEIIFEKMAEKFLTFLEKNNYKPEFQGLVIAGAGIKENPHTLSLTNTKLTIDTLALKEGFPLFPKALLINDFSAQALSAYSSIAKDFIPLSSSEKALSFPLAVLGAGTGLGFAFLTEKEGKPFLLESEAGHQDFPFTFKREHELFVFDEEEKIFQEKMFREEDLSLFCRTQLKQNYTSYDDILSGRGLELIHLFITNQERKAWQIMPSSPTFLLYSVFFARAMRNMCLAFLPQSLLISGGIVAKHPHVFNDIFFKEFMDCPKHKGLLEKVSIFLNTNEQAGLYGATQFFEHNF